MKITRRQLQRIIKESMDLDPSFYSTAVDKYQQGEDYDFVMTIVEVLSEYPAAHSYLDIEEVANEIIMALESKGLI